MTIGPLVAIRSFPAPSGDHWRAFDPQRLAREYSPSSCIGGDYGPVIALYETRSARARATLRCRRDLRYGVHPDERVDVFPAAGGDAPLLVYFHGGYWQELSKEASAFAAADAVAAGCAYAAVGYTLAPRATIEGIVDQCRRALAWLAGQAPALGVDPRRIVVAGSSAGAHLAAMTLAAGPPVAGAVLVSGVYDLRPLVGTDVNDALGLDEARAAAASPIALDWRGAPPVVVAWGDIETAEFHRQSRDFATVLRAAGVPCETVAVRARNHFDVILDLCVPDTALGAATLARLRGVPGAG